MIPQIISSNTAFVRAPNNSQNVYHWQVPLVRIFASLSSSKSIAGRHCSSMALGIGCLLHVGRWLLLVCLINQCRHTVASDSSSLASDSSGGWQQGAQSDQKEDCNIARMPNFNATLFQSIYEHKQPVIFPRLILPSKLVRA